MKSKYGWFHKIPYHYVREVLSKVTDENNLTKITVRVFKIRWLRYSRGAKYQCNRRPVYWKTHRESCISHLEIHYSFVSQPGDTMDKLMQDPAEFLSSIYMDGMLQGKHEWNKIFTKGMHRKKADILEAIDADNPEELERLIRTL